MWGLSWKQLSKPLITTDQSEQIGNRKTQTENVTKSYSKNFYKSFDINTVV